MVGEFFLQEGNQGLCRRCPREAMGNDGPFPMIGEELFYKFIARALKCMQDVCVCKLRRGLQVSLYVK